MAKGKRKRTRLPSGSPPFEGMIENYGLKYFRKNRWKIAAASDDEDIQQDVFLMYWRVRVQHPEITDVTEFMRLYRPALYGCLVWRSRQCFPNPYNLGHEARCYSLDYRDDPGVLANILYASGHKTGEINYAKDLITSLGAEIESYLELVQQLPLELQEAFTLLVREFVGCNEVPLKVSKKLNGKTRREPLKIALARKIGCDLKRDLICEIGQLLGVIAVDERST